MLLAEETESLLIVDDSKAMRNLLKTQFESVGFEVETYSSGKKLLNTDQLEQSDLILLDVMMPQLSGFEVLTRIRDQYSRGELPVIMVTSEDRGEDVSEALEAGANDYITKPVDFTAARARVRTHLQLKQAQEQIKQAFGQYLSKSVMNKVLNQPEELQLGGKRREITVLYADIQKFTNFSENRSATEVAEAINSILTEATQSVFDQNGILDKYMGDALMAEFGMFPDIEPDQPELRACKSALEMSRSVQDLDLTDRSDYGLDVRIGIHTGYAAVGNMGSEMLFDYTIIGDTPNLGSRLESINKIYGTKIIISNETYRKVQDHIVAREIDRVIVRGRSKPLEIYEIQGLTGEVQPEVLDLKEAYEKALEYYRNQEWQEALDQLDAIRSNHPDDDPTKRLIQQTKKLRSNPPESFNWNGVFLNQYSVDGS